MRVVALMVLTIALWTALAVAQPVPPIACQAQVEASYGVIQALTKALIESRANEALLKMKVPDTTQPALPPKDAK